MAVCRPRDEDPGPVIRIPCTLHLDSGETWEVTADQRDMETAEQTLGRKGLTTTDNPVTFARCLSWAAARREGRTTKPWADFTTDLIEADTAAPDPVDPTPPPT